MLEIALDADDEWDSSRPWQQIARNAAAAAIAESAFPDLTMAERPAEISIRLTGDDEVRALNVAWRGKDTPTNVLSFPMAEANDLAEADSPGPELMLGDIILARGVCAAEAAEKARVALAMG